MAILIWLGDVNMRPNPGAGPIPSAIKPFSGQAPSSRNVRFLLHAAPNNATLCKPVTSRLTAAALFQPEEPAYLACRELGCLHWVLEGKTNWEIGVLTGVTARSVQFYLGIASRNLGVVSRVQAAVRAL